MNLYCIKTLLLKKDLIISLIPSILSLVTIIINYRQTKIQNNQFERNYKLQKEQFETTLQLQKERYEEEINENKENLRIQRKPYLVVSNSECNCNGNSDHNINIKFKNVGNGTAFKIYLDESIVVSNGVIIHRQEALTNTVIPVEEEMISKWGYNNTLRGFLFSIVVKFEDAAQLKYKQNFIFSLSDNLHVQNINWSEPELVD